MSAVVDAREGSVAPLSMVSLSDQQGHAYYVDEFASQPLLQFKAELVMWMLEARVGQESFRGMLSKILAGAKGANQQQHGGTQLTASMAARARPCSEFD